MVLLEDKGVPVEVLCRLRFSWRLGTGLGPKVEFNSFTGRFLAFKLITGEPEAGLAGFIS
jgi:hypothetical protein